MDKLKTAAGYILGGLALWAGTLFMTAFLVDAWEWEATGACADCLILPVIDSRFQR